MPTENNETGGSKPAAISVNRDKLYAWFNKYWKNRDCPICGESLWNVESTAFRLERFTLQGQEVMGSPFLTPISVTCKNCGYLMLFDGQQIGVLDVLYVGPGNVLQVRA